MTRRQIICILYDVICDNHVSSFLVCKKILVSLGKDIYIFRKTVVVEGFNVCVSYKFGGKE